MLLWVARLAHERFQGARRKLGFSYFTVTNHTPLLHFDHQVTKSTVYQFNFGRRWKILQLYLELLVLDWLLVRELMEWLLNIRVIENFPSGWFLNGTLMILGTHRSYHLLKMLEVCHSQIFGLMRVLYFANLSHQKRFLLRLIIRWF